MAKGSIFGLRFKLPGHVHRNHITERRRSGHRLFLRFGGIRWRILVHSPFYDRWIFLHPYSHPLAVAEHDRYVGSSVAIWKKRAFEDAAPTSVYRDFRPLCVSGRAHGLARKHFSSRSSLFIGSGSLQDLSMEGPCASPSQFGLL